MDPIIEQTHLRSEEIGLDSIQFGEEIQRLMSSVQPPPPPAETGASFTALLELPANQAVQLLDSSERDDAPEKLSGYQNENPKPYVPVFPGLIDRACKFSVLSTMENSLERSEISAVKQEPVDSDSNPNCSQVVSDSTALKQNQKSSAKRKEREKKVNVSNKKSKSVTKENFEDGKNLPYIHVRARRGQATDSHSLAERARREKINARMKLLQELVPGCNKISGTAMVLDEIINHVQSLQRQVEFLAMRLAAVNPRIDFNLDSILAAEGGGSIMDSSFPMMVMPSMWPEGQVNGNRQQCQQLWNSDGLHQAPIWGGVEDNPSFITMANPLLSYDSSANSAPLHANQLKMEI